ncbi:unnamed protein product [Chondrus crispus]|uniref:Secreted protein n=1 Tax=Chondrus crispus TaxID=2769 RepID=R7Q6U1_CHOCR|nr:unnamed protein product [Chondrus crispus]CDF34257.1 unnamed protein product [Chondrus crispus]|eukprot:XP_005714076.1 unnamed protein product [Chondrus crispus]
MKRPCAMMMMMTMMMTTMMMMMTTEGREGNASGADVGAVAVAGGTRRGAAGAGAVTGVDVGMMMMTMMTGLTIREGW